jgi:hypothetical protein
LGWSLFAWTARPTPEAIELHTMKTQDQVSKELMSRRVKPILQLHKKQFGIVKLTDKNLIDITTC